MVLLQGLDEEVSVQDRSAGLSLLASIMELVRLSLSYTFTRFTWEGADVLCVGRYVFLALEEEAQGGGGAGPAGPRIDAQPTRLY